MSIIFNCGTEYSEFEGTVNRCCCQIINWWREPEQGPWKPRWRIFRIKSRRLQGFHLAISRLLVEVNLIDHGQWVPQL